MQVRIPIAEFPQVEPLAPRALPRSFDGITIGILNNQKPNASALFEAIVAEIRRHGEPSEFVYRTKSPPSPAATQDLDHLAHVADVVLVGSGD
jgi:hypothetical protein